MVTYAKLVCFITTCAAFGAATCHAFVMPGATGYYSRQRQSCFMLKQEIPSTSQDKFDYILVGGGVASCVLSKRLYDRGYKVLVLERGPHSDMIQSSHSTDWPSSWNTKGSKGIEYQDGTTGIVGNCVGGGSTINVGITFDEEPRFFSKHFGSQWWANDDMKKAIRQASEYIGAIDSIPAGAACKAIVRSLAHLNPELRYQQENKKGQKTFKENSIFKCSMTLREYPQYQGEYYRHGPEHLLRQNCPGVQIRHSSAVERVLFDHDCDSRTANTNSNGVPNAVGVKYVQTHINGRELEEPIPQTAFLENGGEVVFCAGAFGSPTLLMHSGIGDQDHLSEFGIKTIVHQKTVGQNLIDRPLVPILALCDVPAKERDTWVPFTVTKGKGIMEMSAGNTFQVLVTSLAFIPKVLRRFIKVRALARFVLNFLPAKMKTLVDESVVLACGISEVRSRGRIKLVSRSPFDPPVIESPFLSDPLDLAQMKATVLAARNAIVHASNSSQLDSSSPYKWIIRRIFPQMRLPSPSDESLTSFCKTHVLPFFHHFGTCSIGSVVDETLSVYGVSGLRVCDGSVFPVATRINPQQAIVAMAWRAADIFHETRYDALSVNERHLSGLQ